jgi:thiamine kinase-like enzyme
MTDIIPECLRNWLNSSGWTLTDWRLVEGTHQATVHECTVVRGLEERAWVYKELTMAQHTEQTVAKHVLPHLQNFSPHIVHIFEGAETPGILSVHGGLSLTSQCRRQSLAHTLSWFQRCAVTLAELHSRHESSALQWHRAGYLPSLTYAECSEWRESSFAIIEHEAKALEDVSGVHAATGEARRFRQRWYALEPLFQRSLDGRKTITHGDPHRGNWIVQDTDQLRLVDWEAARYASPARDIATLVQDFPEEQGAESIYTLYCQTLEQAGWDTSSPTFRLQYLCQLADALLMMMGWEYRAIWQHPASPWTDKWRRLLRCVRAIELSFG